MFDYNYNYILVFTAYQLIMGYLKPKFDSIF